MGELLLLLLKLKIHLIQLVIRHLPHLYHEIVSSH